MIGFHLRQVHRYIHQSPLVKEDRTHTHHTPLPAEAFKAKEGRRAHAITEQESAPILAMLLYYTGNLRGS